MHGWRRHAERGGNTTTTAGPELGAAPGARVMQREALRAALPTIPPPRTHTHTHTNTRLTLISLLTMRLYSPLMNSGGRSPPSLMPRLLRRKPSQLILTLTCQRSWVGGWMDGGGEGGQRCHCQREQHG
jgi:hypothetical protein